MKPYRRLDLHFGTDTFPGTATIAFEANFGENSGPDQRVIVEAGRRGTWVLTFRPQRDLPTGSQVAFRKVENEFRFDWRHQDYWPQAMGYVTVEDQNGEALPFECEKALKAAVPAVVTLPRDMSSGEAIIVRIGDQRQGGAGVVVNPTTYERARMITGVMLPGDREYRRVPDAVMSVKVVACPPVKRYCLFAPSTAQPGQIADIRAIPVDQNGNPISAGRTVDLASPTGTEPMTEVGFRHGLQARVLLEKEGLARLTLHDRGHDITTVSNPIRVTRSGPNIYWGEFHCHGFDGSELNVLNDNTHPDNMYRYGRDITRLDFVAMGSHIFRHAPQAVGEWWEMYREAATKYDEEGRYVTFLGCEWRDREDAGGDRNLIWKYLDAPVPDPTWKIDQVYEHLASQSAMVTPHVGGAIAFPCCHDSSLERLCEMTSGHGNFEWFAQEYLQKGYRVGLIGGSDGHKGTPGHPRIVGGEGGRFFNLLRRRDSGWLGGPLLAVYAQRLDRDSLWKAFHERHVYASTGARALVAFRINGAMMGSEITARGNVKIKIDVEGTAPIARVDLIRGAHRRARWDCDETHFVTEMIDAPPSGETYYYVRIEQQDGELLWSSPIWVESSSGSKDVELPAWNEPEPLDLSTIEENEASQHLSGLQEYLRREERLEAFEHLTPVRVVHSSLGDYAVFFCYVRGKRIRIHWFYEFEVPRLRLEVGWVQYGREIIKGQPWATPLIESQDRMG